MASEAEKRGIPGRLPVMAALVESNLTNVDFGDADSLGYFQMRVSIWESKYPGFADDPEKQIDWFLDQAEAVKAQRLSRGQSVTDPGQFGEWIADIERPAEQFRGRYQLRLDEADTLLKSAPEAPAAPAEPAPTADAVADAAPPAVARQAGTKALAALAEAQKYTGTPYRWGGSTPETGFDCSGLVQWAYAKVGIQIPRVTYDQIDAPNGSPVRRAELLPGDLVFFRDAAGSVHHVGISMGGDKFLHAPHTGDVVKVSSLDEPYYKAQFTGGRRFDTTAGAAPAAPARARRRRRRVADPAAVAAARAAVERDAAAARISRQRRLQGDHRAGGGEGEGAGRRAARRRQGARGRRGRRRRPGHLAAGRRRRELRPRRRRRRRGARRGRQRAHRLGRRGGPGAGLRHLRRRGRGIGHRLGAGPAGGRPRRARGRRPGGRRPRSGRTGRRRPTCRPAPRPTSPTCPRTTPATTRARRSSRSGSPSAPRRPGCRPSCRSWPRSWSRACRT